MKSLKVNPTKLSNWKIICKSVIAKKDGKVGVPTDLNMSFKTKNELVRYRNSCIMWWKMFFLDGLYGVNIQQNYKTQKRKVTIRFYPQITVGYIKIRFQNLQHWVVSYTKTLNQSHLSPQKQPHKRSEYERF